MSGYVMHAKKDKGGAIHLPQLKKFVLVLQFGRVHKAL